MRCRRLDAISEGAIMGRFSTIQRFSIAFVMTVLVVGILRAGTLYEISSKNGDKE